jgi:hypothetical protein
LKNGLAVGTKRERNLIENQFKAPDLRHPARAKTFRHATL